MKKKIILLLVFIFVFTLVVYCSLIIQRVIIDGNNIRAYFQNTGIFNQNTSAGNLAGFEWPKNSGKTAIFTSGLCLTGLIPTSAGDKLAECMASYSGEWAPSYIPTPLPGPSGISAGSQPGFKIYKVSRGDNSITNQDWSNWGLMVPYGAPFIDVNGNGTYEPAIDTPGVKNAVQTIFVCLTDAVLSQRTTGEGFGGGIVSPYFYAEVHMTAWCYDVYPLQDVQFIKWNIINKGDSVWKGLYSSIVADPDLGNPKDDYGGCDTLRKLAFFYNSTNYDSIYGSAPPAAGFLILKGFVNKNIIPNKNLGLTSFNKLGITLIPPCNTGGGANSAYLISQGFKSDSSCWMDISKTPPKKTKYVYSGDPESNTGWTAKKGFMNNCGRDTTGIILNDSSNIECRYVLSTGANDLNVQPGDTQTIILAQLIARGNSNLNSVTKLKQYADVIIAFYNNNYSIGIQNISTNAPDKFSLSQNYPNPFNPVTKIKFEIPSSTVIARSEATRQSHEGNTFPLFKGGQGGFITSLKVYDIAGREVQTLVNEPLQPGTYEVTFDGSGLSSGIYFYQLKSGDFIQTKKLVLLK